MAKHHLTQANEVYYGKARFGPAYTRYGRPGVQITPELFHIRFGAIAAASANAAAASQSVGAGANFVLNGALASGGVVTFPTPRNVVAAWTTTSILTIRGTDEYGVAMVETSASGASHTGTKAFKTITSITSSASITGATVGTGVAIGLPFRIGVGDLITAKTDNAVDAATIVVAVTTSPATGTTGDVRGTITFAAAPNGTAAKSALLRVYDPTTAEGAYGVAQYAG